MVLAAATALTEKPISMNSSSSSITSKSVFKLVEHSTSALLKSELHSAETETPLLQILEDVEPDSEHLLEDIGKTSIGKHHLSTSQDSLLSSNEIHIEVIPARQERKNLRKSMEMTKSLDLRRSLNATKPRQSVWSQCHPRNIRNLTWKGALRLTILAVLLAGITTFLGFLIGSNNVQIAMVKSLEWLSKLPIWGSSLLMSGMYCVALLLFCPGTPFNLAAGYLFGIYIGTGVALGGCMMGAVVAFILGRTLARDWVKGKMESRPKFKAVDWAIQKNGLYIVFLTRLSPLFPFPLLNYAFGITKVRIWQYGVGTFAGVLPATVGYTYLGTLMRNLTDIWTATEVSSDDLTSGSANKNPNFVWLIVGCCFTLLSIVIISLITKRAIAKATREYELQQQQLNEQNIGDSDAEKTGDDINIKIEDDSKEKNLEMVELEEV